MAGFRHRARASVDISMVAYPSVTLLVDLSEGAGVAYETHGRHEHGSVVVGLLPGDLRTTGRGVGELLQIRLEQLAAATLFGASTELSGTVAALEDVWGRDAGRAEGRLRAAASWDERFTIAADILGRRLGTHPPVDPEVAHAWRRARGRAGPADRRAGRAGHRCGPGRPRTGPGSGRDRRWWPCAADPAGPARRAAGAAARRARRATELAAALRRRPLTEWASEPFDWAVLPIPGTGCHGKAHYEAMLAISSAYGCDHLAPAGEPERRGACERFDRQAHRRVLLVRHDGGATARGVDEPALDGVEDVGGLAVAVVDGVPVVLAVNPTKLPLTCGLSTADRAGQAEPACCKIVTQLGVDCWIERGCISPTTGARRVVGVFPAGGAAGPRKRSRRQLWPSGRRRNRITSLL
ncbi:hypothetical protein [Streptosporangium sandarakinum]|uniref:hypothetical protein n=1 Tax=Streptosporangium sandarakinum TaxID=1260955 RepID=UPI00371D95E1